jgi:hypothetical protein
MSDYKATPEQWAQLERSQVFNGSFQACVLELRARVEALEAANRARLIETLRLTNAVADQVPNRNKFLTDTMADEGDAKPTPNDRQIRRSLVDRVALVISRCEDSAAWDDEALNWASEARAAIREVAAWVEETQHDHWSAVSRILRFELEQETGK